MSRSRYLAALFILGLVMPWMAGAQEEKDKSVVQGKKIVFVAGNASHGYGSHEHYAGSRLLAAKLQQSMGGYKAEVIQNGWPKDESVFDGADCIVMYCDGGGGHFVNPHLEKMDALAKKGVGIVCIHYGVEVPKGPSGDKFLDWIGGYFEMNYSVNPHWVAKYEKFPDHPISRGVKPFEINDEWYYHMRFRPDMKGVTPILSAHPPKSTLDRPDGSHSGNPDVRKAIAAGEIQHMGWAAERDGGGRGFGFTGGHVHWNWGDPNFRKVMLNAIVWCAHGEVPTNGVGDTGVTLEDLEANQDEPQPADFNRDQIRKELKLGMSKRDPRRRSVGQAAVKPAFQSGTVSPQTEGHSVAIEADIKGAKELYLVVRDGGDSFGCDWADWIEPVLVGPKGEKKLTELKWKSASSQFGNVNVDKNAGGSAMKVNGKEVAFGIGTHANSVIAFDLPEGYEKFKARGGLDNGGTGQGCGSTVQFAVYTQNPGPLGDSGASAPVHDPENAVANLDVAPGLEATLVASEPDILNLASMDIDAKGRLWVCEVVNYRGHNGKRPEGDRILILEDKDGDGVADETKVFYQGRDVDSALGICVLGNKVIVSCAPNVIEFTDKDGDDKPDEKRMLFTNVGQPQHDHSAHSFVFGPDGKLYWNVGNTGKQVCDSAGKPIIDMAGNKVIDNGKPYWGGMVFRCNMDGAEFEVLAHNFRNNYETTVDSFGNLWQSDNDDDGNKGVRINYVMEFGNYGYLDELTGAGWQSPRENIEKEIPFRHWHLNDPGVVPNLLQTGQGSPTGICFYEGTLLPEVFRNQMIHCDAGPSVVRAYPVTVSGAGYHAETVNVLQGARDNWFRPADVCVAPDGSIFVADWFDPGVGGHQAGEINSGRLFRVAPPGVKYEIPKYDYSTAEGAIAALGNPNNSVRYLAWTALHGMGDKAEPALAKVFANSDNARLRARALWLLGKIDGKGKNYVAKAIDDKDPNIQIVGLRLARQLKLDLVPMVEKLVKSPSPAVRRECAISLRHNKSPKAAELWTELAMQYDGKDRWYLEALGISADRNWDAWLDAFLKKVGDKWTEPAPRDVVWRSRAKVTPGLLAKLIKSDKLGDQEDKFFRAMDFQADSPEKKAAVASLTE